MEPNQKKGIKDLFQNKQVLYIIPVLLLLVGGFLYMALKSPEDDVTQKSAINTSVPAAKTDTTSANKLDLQERHLSERGEDQDNFQSAVPGSLDSYVYSRQEPERDIKGLTRNEDLAASKSAEGNIPRTLTNQQSGPPLSEADIMMTGDRPPRRLSEADLARKAEETNKLVADRQRLMSLLEEYKKDKTHKQQIEGDKEVVSKVDPAGVVGSLNPGVKGGNGFYGLYAEDAKKVNEAALEKETGTIRAMVYGDQEVVSQGRIKMRLLEPVTVRGIVIPANSLIYGIGNFGAERVQVRISSINYQDHLLPVSMTVYDIDGMAGIYVPNVLGVSEARGAMAQTASGVNLNTGYGSNAAAALGTSAANAALQGARSLVQKKMTVQKAYLKTNYYVLLRSVSARTAETN